MQEVNRPLVFYYVVSALVYLKLITSNYFAISEWQWHQLGCMQVCTSLQTDNHANTPPLSFLQAGCPSCYPTNSVKALKATNTH